MNGSLLSLIYVPSYPPYSRYAITPPSSHTSACNFPIHHPAAAAIKYTEMATQTVGVGNVLSNMDEVFGRSYHLPLGGGVGASKPPEHLPSGNKQENGSSVIPGNCNRAPSNPGGVVTAATNTPSSAQQQQQQQLPPSYHSAVNTSVEKCSPTRIPASAPVAAVSSNGGPAAPPHLLTDKPSSVHHHNGSNSNSNFDALL